MWEDSLEDGFKYHIRPFHESENSAENQVVPILSPINPSWPTIGVGIRACWWMDAIVGWRSPRPDLRESRTSTSGLTLELYWNFNCEDLDDLCRAYCWMR